MFVADFETYMPDEFNDAPYGKAGVLATADAAGIDIWLPDRHAQR